MITAIGDVMREAYKRGWITTRDGNISLRRKGSDLIYITPSGWRKTIIHPEHMVKVKLTPAGVSIKGDVKASGELHMHSMIQRYRKRTTAVVHLHPTYTVAAMYAGIDLQELAQDFPELGRYTRVAPSVPVLPVTSSELAIATFSALAGNERLLGSPLLYDIVGQASHGVCAVAHNPWDAFEHIERLEHICQIALVSGKHK